MGGDVSLRLGSLSHLSIAMFLVLSIVPNCAVKNKRDTKWLVGDQMQPEVVAQPAPGKGPASNVVHKITDYSGLYVRRAHERVRLTPFREKCYTLEYAICSTCSFGLLTFFFPFPFCCVSLHVL